jgi:hypothetical protein
MFGTLLIFSTGISPEEENSCLFEKTKQKTPETSGQPLRPTSQHWPLCNCSGGSWYPWLPGQVLVNVFISQMTPRERSIQKMLRAKGHPAEKAGRPTAPLGGSLCKSLSRKKEAEVVQANI